MTSLPDEVLSLVLSRLPPRFLFTNTPLVCRRWRRVSRMLTHPNGAIPVHLTAVLVPSGATIYVPFSAFWPSMVLNNPVAVVSVTVHLAESVLENITKGRDFLTHAASRVIFNDLAASGEDLRQRINATRYTFDLSFLSTRNAPDALRTIPQLVAQNWFHEYDKLVVSPRLLMILAEEHTEAPAIRRVQLSSKTSRVFSTPAFKPEDHLFAVFPKLVTLHFDIYGWGLPTMNIRTVFGSTSLDVRSRITSLTISNWYPRFAMKHWQWVDLCRADLWPDIRRVVDEDVPFAFPNLRHLSGVPTACPYGEGDYISWPEIHAQSSGNEIVMGAVTEAHARLRSLRAVLAECSSYNNGESEQTQRGQLPNRNVDVGQLPPPLRDLVMLTQRYPNLTHVEIAVPGILPQLVDDWAVALCAISATRVDFVESGARGEVGQSFVTELTARLRGTDMHVRLLDREND